MLAIAKPFYVFLLGLIFLAQFFNVLQNIRKLSIMSVVREGIIGQRTASG